MISSPKRVDVDSLIAEYNIDVDSTRLVRVRGLKASTNVFKVDRSDLIEELYLVDTVQGKDIACHPHIVGKRLKNQAFKAALEAAKAINQLTDLSKMDRDSIVVENVLRASPGYELHPAFRELNTGMGFRDVWIRPRYEKPSYRDHDEKVSKTLNIVYEDLVQPIKYLGKDEFKCWIRLCEQNFMNLVNRRPWQFDCAYSTHAEALALARHMTSMLDEIAFFDRTKAQIQIVTPKETRIA